MSESVRRCPICRLSYPLDITFCPQDGTLLTGLVPHSPAKQSTYIGETIGNYRIVEVIGEGGMGTVYRAENQLIGKKVALKILSESCARDPQMVARFFTEAKAVNNIGHDNIIDILDFGQTPNGIPFLLMELLEGK